MGKTREPKSLERKRSRADKSVQESPIQKLEDALAAIETNLDHFCNNSEFREQWDRLVKKIASKLRTSPQNVDLIGGGANQMDQDGRAIVGRLYALIGHAEIDSDGRLEFVFDPCVEDSACRSLINRIADEVNEGKSLPVYGRATAVAPSCNGCDESEKFRQIEDAVAIDSQGTLLFVEDASFALEKIS